MNLQNNNPPSDLLATAMALYRPKAEGLLPVPDQTTATLPDDAAAAAMAAMYGPDIQPRDALRQQIKANADLLTSGDTVAMSEALARQATALDLATYGLLAALAAAKTADHRLVLAKAVATLHGATLRSLSAIRQISGSEQAPRAIA